jgi:rare lipoprotein A
MRLALAWALGALAAGCATTPQPERPLPTMPEPGHTARIDPVAPPGSPPGLPRGPGNPPFYEVMGQRYHVLPDSDGYEERGVASWYGREFHGRRTSNGEVYDMYGLTAAHKTLPLPTNARVTNLATGKSIVVRINDRGPFKKDRLIDLSYGAARELGFLSAGTTLVEVEAIGEPLGAGGALADASPPPLAMYVQIGAFGERENAEQLRRTLEREGFANVVIRYDAQTRPALFRVRIGPVADAAEYDAVASRVARLGVGAPRLVTEIAANDGSPAATSGTVAQGTSGG